MYYGETGDGVLMTYYGPGETMSCFINRLSKLDKYSCEWLILHKEFIDFKSIKTVIIQLVIDSRQWPLPNVHNVFDINARYNANTFLHIYLMDWVNSLDVLLITNFSFALAEI